jgi:hypothetical protein
MLANVILKTSPTPLSATISVRPPAAAMTGRIESSPPVAV